MQRAIITPFTLAPAALAELKDWLGITTMQDDAALAALLRTALELCEGVIGTMPLAQVCEEVLPVTSGWCALRSRPIQAITQVEGIPAEGSRFALPAADYEIELDAAGLGMVRVSNAGAAGRIAVRFTAGLVADWAGLPETLRHGAIRLAAHQFRHREGEASGPLPPSAVAALWRPWRRMRIA